MIYIKECLEYNLGKKIQYDSHRQMRKNISKKLVGGSCVLSLILVLSSSVFANEASVFHGTSTLLPGAAIYKGMVSIEALQAVPKFLKVQPIDKHQEMLKHRMPQKKLMDKFKLPLLKQNSKVSTHYTESSYSPGFIGLLGQDNIFGYKGEIDPPDQGLAVNNDIVAEVTNLELQFFNATTGIPLTGAIPLNSFFLDDSLGDPQVFFDHSVSRWFFIAINSNGRSGTGGFNLAVSQTSNPLGSYHLYNINLGTTNIGGCDVNLGCLPDYPKAGYDKNGFYISANLFNNNQNKDFVNAAIYALSKTKLMNAVAPTVVQLIPSDKRFLIQPSVPAPGQAFVSAENGTEYLMEARNIMDRTNTITVWAITNTASLNSSPALQLTGATIAVEPYVQTVDAIQPNVINPMCSSFGGSIAPTLDGEYGAFQSTVQFAGNRLYGVLPMGSNDTNGFARDIAAWFVVTPTISGPASNPILNASVANQGYIVPPNGYSLLNPSFGLNNSGNGILGFSITNPNQNLMGGFPSAAIVQVTSGVPQSTIFVTGIGQNSAQSFTGCKNQPGITRGRWGDYGAATVDAATGIFYAANEMIPSISYWGMRTNWGTFITKMAP